VAAVHAVNEISNDLAFKELILVLKTTLCAVNNDYGDIFFFIIRVVCVAMQDIPQRLQRRKEERLQKRYPELLPPC
jgi:hypothetical protein